MSSHTARRQASTTSLSKYANYGRVGSPVGQDAGLDFCNAFWGLGDGGVDVLFARLRGAARTIDELRNFWKERAAIEEDYAKRLGRLAKTAVGRDEIGELRSCLDTLKSETDRQAGYHQTLAGQLRNDLENPTTTFCARQAHHKKTVQSSIEKEFKSKQTQESYVTKAREKYEQDCMRINSYTAQASLVQGRDLEKITMKLEKAQQTVHANERDFANFAKALSDTVLKWEKDWKSFCDSAQDLEEERIDFMKDHMWTYANAVSTVCVADDEACEKMRLALEQMAGEVEMENFVRDYSTGNEIPDPPAFVNYTAPDAIPSSASAPTARPANFMRVSQRQREPPMSNRPPESPQDEGPPPNMVGVGAIGKRASQPDLQSDLSRQPTQRASTLDQPKVNGRHTPANSIGGPSQPSSLSRAPTASASYRPTSSAADPHADPINPSAVTYMKIGGNAYKVDLSKDPQQQTPQRASTMSQGSTAGGGVDPLAKQMEDLRSAATVSGSVRRSTTTRHSINLNDTGSAGPSTPSRRGTRDSALAGSSVLSLPGTAGSAPPPSTSPARDYRNSAEMVVGSYPPSASRSASPSGGQPAPTAAFMQPPRSSPSPADEHIDTTLSEYHQALPGERSRRGSYSNISPARSPSSASGYSHSHQHSQSLSQPAIDPARIGRQPSIGHAGVGAHGRSRSPSPAPGVALGGGTSPGGGPQQGSGMRPPSVTAQRTTSPNTVGIALDPSGRVLVDDMAQRFQQQRPPPPQQQQQQAQRPPSQQQFVHPQQQRRPSFNMTPSQSGMMPQSQSGFQQPPQQSSGFQQVPPPPPIQYQQQQQHVQSPSYTSAPGYHQQQQPPYQPPQQPQQFQAPPPQHHPQYAQQQQQTPQVNGASGFYQQPQQNVGSRRNLQQQQQPQQQPPPHQQHGSHSSYHNQQMVHQPQQQQMSYANHGGRRSPSPMGGQGRGGAAGPVGAPTGQTTDEGSGILFYVKALYDYVASIDEEFDFQAGDIIAVTATPEDGWWSGELLDESRRQPGKHVFPSNFVCLF